MKEDPKKLIYILAAAVLFLLGIVFGLSVVIFMKEPSPQNVTQNNSRQARAELGHENEGAANLVPDRAPPPRQDEIPAEKIEKFSKFSAAWMSEKIDENSKQGYSLLFDLNQTRKFILEKCSALMYIDPQTQKAVKPRAREGNDICTPLVWLDILDLDDSSITLIDRMKNRKVTLPFHISENKAVVKIEKLEIVFKPGTRNDLLQRLEALESVKREKEEALRQTKPRPRNF